MHGRSTRWYFAAAAIALLLAAFTAVLAQEGVQDAGVRFTWRMGESAGRRECLIDLAGKASLKLLEIPAGRFRMGSPEDEYEREDDEGPQTEVELTHTYWLGETEITQAQWEAVMGANPSNFRGAALPVDQVSWADARAFCERLSERTGLRFDLPTEAQWEHACRAGTQTRYSFGEAISGNQLNHDGRYSFGSTKTGGTSKTTPAKTFPPNALGLFDMHGNVWEWCADWYGPYSGGTVTDWTQPATGTERVIRGGAWSSLRKHTRSAARGRRPPETRRYNIGLRVCLPEMPEDAE
ncbi:formylglycine-generating enzyme family protein [Candidatus Poribacteria bacterium]|nr:formylglycine-generating enzyme family protein [Candidatus Poribacteria bacterium]